MDTMTAAEFLRQRRKRNELMQILRFVSANYADAGVQAAINKYTIGKDRAAYQAARRALHHQHHEHAPSRLSALSQAAQAARRAAAINNFLHRNADNLGELADEALGADRNDFNELRLLLLYLERRHRSTSTASRQQQRQAPSIATAATATDIASFQKLSKKMRRIRELAHEQAIKTVQKMHRQVTTCVEEPKPGVHPLAEGVEGPVYLLYYIIV